MSTEDADGVGSDLSAADAALLEGIAAALAPDPVPAGLVDRAADLFLLRDLDAGLAALLDEAVEPAGARGGGAATGLITFQPADGNVTVEVAVDEGRISGQVLCEGTVAVRLQTAAGSEIDVPVDTLVRFAVEPPDRGPVRLRLTVDGRHVDTDWFTL